MTKTYHQKNKFKQILATLLIVALLQQELVAVATTPVQSTIKSTKVECLTGAVGCGGNWEGPVNWYVANRGWHISKLNYWTKSSEIPAIEIVYSDDLAVALDQSYTWGYTTGATKQTNLITKRVATIKMVDENGQQGFHLYYKDGTSNWLGMSGQSGNTPAYIEPICGNFIGMRVNMRCAGLCMADKSTDNKIGACSAFDDIPVQSYYFLTTIADFNYIISSGSSGNKFWETTNLLCYSEVYTLTYTKDGVLGSKPACITVSTAAGNSFLSVLSTSKTDIGVYVITIQGKLNGLNDPATSQPWITTTSFTLTIQSDCVNTTMTTKTMTNMSILVAGTAVTQDVAFWDSKGTSHSDITWCGTRTYTLSPTKAFLTISGTTMTLSTSSPSDIGTTTFRITIGLIDFPLIPTIFKDFNVTITCTVQTLVFTTSPALSTTVKVGIDAQPVNLAFALTKTPNCAQSPTYTLTPSVTFITKSIAADNVSGNIVINGATLANLGTNSMTLTASVDSQNASKNFTVIIKDPCDAAVFQITPAPLVDMTVTMLSVATSTQTVAIKTDIQVSNPSIICPITATLTPAAAYISLSVDYATISVNAASIVLPTNIGTNAFVLTVNSANFSGTVLQQTYNFNVIVVCTVLSLSVALPIAPLTYILNQGAFLTSAFAVTQTAACQFPFTFTHAYVKAGVSVTPTWSVFSSATTKYTFTITSAADVGIYTVTGTATIPQVDPATSVNRKFDMSFTVTVLSDCVNTTITDKIISNMTAKVAQAAATQDITFLDSIATSKVIPTYCGARTYALSPTKAFLTISGTTITLQTSLQSDVGITSFTLTIGLQDYPGVAILTKTLDTIISCEVMTLAFTTVPTALTTVQVGIDAQPIDIPFSTMQTPNCLSTITFTISPSTDSFTSLQNLTSTGGLVRVSGATIAQHGMYPYVLTASVDAQTLTTNFSVFVKDPCSSAVLQAVTPSPLSEMSIIMYYQTTETMQRSVKIFTDVERSYSTIICPITAVLTPSLSYITLSGDYTSISFDGASTTQLDVGVHPMSLTVKSANFPGSVAEVIYAFNLDLQACEVSSFTMSNSILDFSYMITSGNFMTSTFVAGQTSLACNFPITYTDTWVVGAGSPISRPVFVTFDSTNRNFLVNSIDQADVNVYLVTIAAQIPQVLELSGVKTLTFDFVITVLSDCILSMINSRTIDPMLHNFSLASATQDIAFTDSIGTVHLNQSYCGVKTYTLSPLNTFLTNSGSILTLFTNDFANLGEMTMTVEVRLQDYPMVPTQTVQFKTTIVCHVSSIMALTSPALYSRFEIQIQAPIIMPFNFVATPACPLTYSLSPAVSYASLGMPQERIIVSSFDLEDRGLKHMILTATPSLGNPVSVFFKIDLIDLCMTTQFIVQTIANLEVIKQSSFYGQINFISWTDFMTAAGLKGMQCGQVDFTLSLKDSLDPVPSFIQLDGTLNRLQVNFAGQKAQTIKLNLNVSLNKHPQITFKTSFEMRLSEAKFDCLSAAKMNYKIGDPSQQFGILYLNKTDVLSTHLAQVMEPIAYLDDKQVGLPLFIQFDPKSKIFSVKSMSYYDKGDWQIGLRLGYREYPDADSYCKKPLEVIYKPTFVGGEQLSFIKISCLQDWSYKFPVFQDLDGKEATITVDLAATDSFLIYDQYNHVINIVGDLHQHVGFFKFSYTLKDSHNESQEFQVSVVVICTDQVEVKSNYVPNYKKPPPKPFIEWVNQMGKVRVGFTRPIEIPNYETYPEFKAEQFMRQNCTNGETTCEAETQSRRLTPQPTLSAWEQQRQAIEIVNRGLISENSTMFPVVDLHMIPGTDSDATQLSFTWVCINFTNTYMDFDVNYTQYQNVSIHDARDVLEVSYNGREYFKSEDGQFFENTSLRQQKMVPPQIDPALGASIASIASMVSNSSKAVVIGQLIMNLFLGGVLQQLFQVMNKLQIMVHLLIVNVDIPVNAAIFFSGLLNLVTYSLVKLEKPIENALHLTKNELEPLNKNFAQLGYTSNYYILNASDLFLVAMMIMTILLFILLTSNVNNEKIKKIREYACSKMIWNGVLSFINESFLLTAVSCFSNFTDLKWGNNGERFATLLCFVVAFFTLLLYPACGLLFFRKNKDSLNQKALKERYGIMYENLNHKQGGATLYEPFFSQMRILIFVGALIFLQKFRYFQVFISIFLCTFIIVYQNWCVPYHSKNYSFFQNFNECFVMFMNYFLICYEDFVQDKKTLNSLGQAMIGVVSLNLVVNFGAIIVGALIQICSILRVKYYKWLKAKLKKSIREKRIKKLEKAAEMLELKIAKHREQQAPERIALKRQLEGELGLRVISEVEEEEKNSSSLSIENSEQSICQELQGLEKKVVLLNSEANAQTNKVAALKKQAEAKKKKASVLKKQAVAEEKKGAVSKKKVAFTRQTKTPQLSIFEQSVSISESDADKIEDLELQILQEKRRQHAALNGLENDEVICQELGLKYHPSPFVQGKMQQIDAVVKPHSQNRFNLLRQNGFSYQKVNLPPAERHFSTFSTGDQQTLANQQQELQPSLLNNGFGQQSTNLYQQQYHNKPIPSYNPVHQENKRVQIYPQASLAQISHIKYPQYASDISHHQQAIIKDMMRLENGLNYSNAAHNSNPQSNFGARCNEDIENSMKHYENYFKGFHAPEMCAQRHLQMNAEQDGMHMPNQLPIGSNQHTLPVRGAQQQPQRVRNMPVYFQEAEISNTGVGPDHSMRVAKRQRELNLQIPSLQAAQDMQDELWQYRNKTEAELGHWGLNHRND